MNIVHPSMPADFFVAGINYKKSDGETRGQFAVNTAQYAEIATLAPQYHIQSFFILSTCNRTEIYGFANDPSCLIDLLCSQTSGDKRTFERLAYVKNGRDAVEHLFQVGAGLDSQILGDYEIIGQLKKAVKFASDLGCVNCFIQRLFDSVLQASKSIKNTTGLSNGSISVSFTAIQYLKQHVSTGVNHKVLVIGTGKIGRNTCKNLVDYFGNADITVINRSIEKAADLAAELGVGYATLNELPGYLNSSDIILVATDAPSPVILKKDIEASEGTKLILDLSVPYNVERTIAALSNVTLINVDELSKVTDENLQKRYADLPKAVSIINCFVNDFLNWCEKRQAVPVIKAVKMQLGHICERQLKTSNIAAAKLEAQVQSVVKNMACKMQHDKNYGCHSLEAINELMLAIAN